MALAATADGFPRINVNGPKATAYAVVGGLLLAISVVVLGTASADACTGTALSAADVVLPLMPATA